MNKDLVVEPDIAEQWQAIENGRGWKFKIKPGLTDHGGELITAEKMAQCLEYYRSGRPVSPLRAGFPFWKETGHSNDIVFIKLEKPDPYLPKNISSLRFFRIAGEKIPCADGRNTDNMIGSGPFKPINWDPSPQNQITMTPNDPADNRLTVRFVFIKDSTSALFKIINGEADATQNSLSLTKTRWLQRNYSSRFNTLERNGVAVSYLAFNMRDKVLARKNIRIAIASAISKEEIISNKLLEITFPSSSFLAPGLEESFSPEPLKHDTAYAEQLLDQEGLHRGKNGVRLELHYKTTPIREGFETALMLQEMLGKIGIKIIIDMVEPAVFFASIRKGFFQLYSSRWIGVADGSILFRTLRSGQPLNRIGYSNPAMDKLLDAAISETDPVTRKNLLKQAQELMLDDLPYFPLWFWKNTLIVKKEFTGLTDSSLSLSGGLEPLTYLRYR